MGRRFGGAMLAAVFAAALLAPPATEATYTYNSYVASEWSSQLTTYYCVPATSQMWTNHIKRLSDHTRSTQDSYYTMGQAYGKADYGPTGGVDPRGQAWILYLNTPTGYGFNDYRTTSEAQANAWLVGSIRNGGAMGTVYVAKGEHVVNVHGFEATSDPNNGGSLTGFYASDPWYPRSDPANLVGGPYGKPIFQPNHWIALSTWNAYYLYKYNQSTHLSTFWDNYFVVVLRSSVIQAPRDSPSAPYGYGALAAPEPLPEGTPEPASATIEVAIATGLESTGLADHNELGLDLATVTTGSRVHVDSAIAEFPSYELVELMAKGKVVALALVVRERSGYRLGAVRPVTKEYRFHGSSAATAAFNRAGLRVTSVHAVWGWSQASMSPFMPLWSANEATLGTVFLTPAGDVVPTAVPMPGFTVRSPG